VDQMNCLNCGVDLLETENNWQIIKYGKMVEGYCDKCFDKNRVKFRKLKDLSDKMNYVMRTTDRRIEMMEL